MARTCSRGARLYGAGLPSADLAARLAGHGGDLRREGSGNPGALNAAAALGGGWGMAVLAADMAKGAAAARIGRRVAGHTGAYVAATASVAGHIAPFTTGFHDGNGVATSAGACLAVFPAYFPIDAGVAIVGAAASRRRRKLHADLVRGVGRGGRDVVASRAPQRLGSAAQPGAGRVRRRVVGDDPRQVPPPTRP